MAKVTGPLFSFAAAGSVNNALTFRAHERYFIAQRPPIPTAPASHWQLIERQTMRDAAAAWSAISANDRAIWNNNSLPSIRSGWMSFFLEWKEQRVAAGSAPLIPAQYIGIPTPTPFPELPPLVNHGAIAGHGLRAMNITAPATAPNRGAILHQSMHRLLVDPPATSPNRGLLRQHGARRRLRTP